MEIYGETIFLIFFYMVFDLLISCKDQQNFVV